MTHEDVEPTNNYAERALRAFVLWRRRSFGCQSERGERFAERVMTVAQTLRQQGRDVLDFFVRRVTAHAAGRAAPVLVAASSPRPCRGGTAHCREVARPVARADRAHRRTRHTPLHEVVRRAPRPPRDRDASTACDRGGHSVELDQGDLAGNDVDGYGISSPTTGQL